MTAVKDTVMGSGYYTLLEGEKYYVKEYEGDYCISSHRSSGLINIVSADTLADAFGGKEVFKAIMRGEL